MVSITFVEPDGTEYPVETEEAMTLMEAATLNLVPGVEGMCGGICSCATCHCYLGEPWQTLVPPPSPGEEQMLATACDRTAASRLGCQITVTAAMDGLRVALPPRQGQKPRQ